MIHDDKTKYPESHTDGSKKGSVSDGGYNEQNTKHNDGTNDIPAPSSNQDKPSSASNQAEQDDTGGSHSTGKRSDDL